MESNSTPIESSGLETLDKEPRKRWKPLSREQRRVLGVLIEKSKTTPDVYPMSINGIKTGCNQKSNRSPLLELEEHRVEDVLYELRQLGCVVEVHAGGRVPKYKHQAYDWLEVTKAELSVLAELLLRGEQSLGDLRARSARMEKEIDSLEALRPVLSSLKEKGLLVELTPPGRGQVVTHNLYLPNELERLKQQFAAGNFQSDRENAEEGAENQNSEKEATRSTSSLSSQQLQELTQRVEQLESISAKLQEQLADIKKLIEN
jgi:uncharacterized protein